MWPVGPADQMHVEELSMRVGGDTKILRFQI
jgi:hypothetical protein